MITGIHHISMKCGTAEEYRKAKEFYVDVLGFTVRREWPEGMMIDTGNGLLEISSNQRMTLYGEDFDFSTEANDRIGVDYSGGKDMTLGVKADSIIDELSRIIEPTVTIHFTDPSRAVTITPDDPLYQGEEITMLLMPMLVNE